MFGNSRHFSYSTRGMSTEDFPQRRAFHQDEPRESPLERNGISRPSGRFIYKQRKEYSESLNRNPDSFHVRVEHLYICELDGKEVKTEDDCVTKLKQLDGKGRLWPQEMILEIKGAYLLLSDIETKGELDSIPLNSISQIRAVLDSCAYNSLLTLTVQELGKRTPQVFIFQCEETGADIIKADLDKVLHRGGNDVEPRRVTPDIRNDLENILSRQNSGVFRPREPFPVQQEGNLPPPDYVAPQWNNRQSDYMPDSPPYSPQDEMLDYSDFHDSDMDLQRAEMDRSTDIFNHILTDLEIFMGKVMQAVKAPPMSEGKSKKKFSKKKKSKSNAPPTNLPHWEEYAAFLQKIKYGFNLLAQLNGVLTNPSALDYIHFLFSSLATIYPHYPQDLPPSVVSPLLTQEAVNLLHQEATPEEKQLWDNLGECWSIPRSHWPDDNVAPYIPEFYDGWLPPAPLHSPPDPRRNHPLSRSNSQRFPPGGPEGQMVNGQNYSSRQMLRRPEEPMSNGPMSPQAPQYPTEPPLYMRVMYSFSARNNQELTVMQGEVVKVIQKSRPWWVVRNSSNEEGNVPPNILEPVEDEGFMEEQRLDSRGPVTLDQNSTPAEVKAWLESKHFSRITVSTLGVLTGRLLLGMSKDEIRSVCPEEAGKVFFHLQGVKSSLALSRDQSQMFNRRY